MIMGIGCSICQPPEQCKGYPHLWKRLAEDPERWRKTHDRVNGIGITDEPLRPDPWLPLIRACEDHNPGCCSHPSPFCSRFMKDVSRDDCVLCLKEQGVDLSISQSSS